MTLLFVGLPLDMLPALGLPEPTLSRELPELRIGLPAGGVAVLEIASSEAEADIAFERRLRTAATHWPAPTVPLNLYDRAAGDGTAILLVRERNAVLYVRDLGNDSSTIAASLLGALTTDAARCASTGRQDPDGARWDSCGRLATSEAVRTRP